MKKLPVIFIAVAAFTWGAMTTTAQTQQQGGVTDQEFVIRKDRVLTVPSQPRAFEKLPILPQPKGIENFTYTLTPFFLNIPAMQLQPTALDKNYRKDRMNLFPGFIKAGYGNFASPFLEGRYMSTNADPITYALRFKHQNFGKGPVAEEQSAESHTVFGGDVSYFTDATEVFGGLSWGQDKYSFYGVNPTLFENPDFQTFNNVLSNVQLKAGIRDIEKTESLSYDAQVSFRTFTDSYAAKENEAGIKGYLKFRTESDWSGELGLAFFHTNPTDSTYDVVRNFLSIRPRLSYRYKEFRFTAGLNLASDNDSLPNKESDFRIFPVLKASYQFADEFGFFAEFSGDVQRNTYFTFVNENPFLGPSTQLLNTINTFKIAAGIEGQFQEAFHYRAGIDLSRFNQLHFFANSPADSAKFEIIYDDKSTVFNMNAELGFRFNEVYTLGSRLDLYQYELNLQQEAWHRPVWTLSINNQVKPFKQLLLQANLNFMGGIKARGEALPAENLSPEAEDQYELINLKTIADLQLKADFKINDRFSIFAEGNNLTNGRNVRWLNYPVRGVQLLGGASFKF